MEATCQVFSMWSVQTFLVNHSNIPIFGNLCNFLSRVSIRYVCQHSDMKTYNSHVMIALLGINAGNAVFEAISIVSVKLSMLIFVITQQTRFNENYRLLYNNIAIPNLKGF